MTYIVVFSPEAESRVWIAKEDQHVSLCAGAWKDPAPWGVVLADLAGHIANALEPTEGLGYFGNDAAVELTERSSRPLAAEVSRFSSIGAAVSGVPRNAFSL
jgi:hypothetical protein